MPQADPIPIDGMRPSNLSAADRLEIHLSGRHRHHGSILRLPQTGQQVSDTPCRTHLPHFGPIVKARFEVNMFWTGLVVALVAMVVFKLGALSVWAQVTSTVLTLLFFAALGWGMLAVWRRLTGRT